MTSRGLFHRRFRRRDLVGLGVRSACRPDGCQLSVRKALRPTIVGCTRTEAGAAETADACGYSIVASTPFQNGNTLRVRIAITTSSSAVLPAFAIPLMVFDLARARLHSASGGAAADRSAAVHGEPCLVRIRHTVAQHLKDKAKCSSGTV